MPEHDVAGLGNVLVELQAYRDSPTQQFAQLALAQLQRLPAQVLPVQLDQVEGVEEDGKTWQRFDKVTPHGTLMSVGLHHGDAKQVYVAARYGEVFGTQDGGESWLEMPLPQGVQHVYALACG
jgi:hypothetical protein